jgi:hypothetical protein
MIRRAVLVLTGCACLALSARAELSREQLTELRARLDQLADAIEAGQTNDTRRAAATLERWVRQQDASLPVDVVCERARALAAREFEAGDAEAAGLRDSIRQLSANLAALPTAAPAGDETLAEARVALEQVLAGGEYRQTVQASWWQKVLMRLGRWLERLFDLINRIPGMEKIASVMFYLTVALLLVPLLGVIGYVIWWQTKQRRNAPRVEAVTALAALESPDVHWSRAEAFLGEGRYVEALKQFHLAALAALERSGLVAHDRTRTNWEYLAQLQARSAPPESVPLLRALNRLYDRAVFGAEPCDETQARQFGETSLQLMRAVAGSPPA